MNAVEPILAAGVPSGGVLPRAAPEDVGLSPTRLARIAAMLYGDVARGQLPGAVVAIVRRGKLVAHDAYGYRDKGAGVPMTTDCWAISEMLPAFRNVDVPAEKTTKMTIRATSGPVVG